MGVTPRLSAWPSAAVGPHRRTSSPTSPTRICSARRGAGSPAESTRQISCVGRSRGSRRRVRPSMPSSSRVTSPTAASLLPTSCSSSIVRPVVDRLGCALVLTGGNHDERGALARVLFGVEDDAPQDRVTTVRGLRIVTLDSAVPGYHHGGFSDDQYAWLAEELATPAQHGTVLVIHHAPITYRSPVMQLLDFDDVDRLRAAVAGTDVRAVLSGHLHVTSFGQLGHVPVIVAGGVSYVDDVGAPRLLLMGVDGPQSWNLVEVHDRRGRGDRRAGRPARDLAGSQRGGRRLHGDRAAAGPARGLLTQAQLTKTRDPTVEPSAHRSTWTREPDERARPKEWP